MRQDMAELEAQEEWPDYRTLLRPRHLRARLTGSAADIFRTCMRPGRASADAAQTVRISESEDLTMQIEQLRHFAAFHASHPAFCADAPFPWSG